MKILLWNVYASIVFFYILNLGLCSIKIASNTDFGPSQAHNPMRHINLLQKWKAENLLVLFQTLTFEDFGYIESWSGMIYIDKNFQTNLSTSPLMHLQVWRPSKRKTTFSLVGETLLTLASISNIKKGYQNFIADGIMSEKKEFILVQPKDIVGIYISSGKLGVITNLETNKKSAMNLCFNTSQVECQVSVYDEQLVRIRPSLPFVYPHVKVLDYGDWKKLSHYSTFASCQGVRWNTWIIGLLVIIIMTTCVVVLYKVTLQAGHRTCLLKKQRPVDKCPPGFSISIYR